MKKLLILLLVLAVAVIAVGFWRGWFDISQNETPTQTDINVTVDKQKIERDADQAAEKAREVGREIEERLE